ncbi:MAG TPA: twin-arginine translocase TatA/TatE family subunit [Actinomycetota bacterium]|nr:twin-arginine translocase TatA/TatE family subunit [Actinomycetota bacterium]
MPSIGPLEILIVAMIGLIVFGPQKLPEIARSIGKAASELRRMASEVRSEFEVGLGDEPNADPAEETRAKSDDVPGRDPSREER